MRLFSVISKTLVGETAEKQSVYSTAPADWVKRITNSTPKK